MTFRLWWKILFWKRDKGGLTGQSGCVELIFDPVHSNVPETSVRVYDELDNVTQTVTRYVKLSLNPDKWKTTELGDYRPVEGIVTTGEKWVFLLRGHKKREYRK